MSLTNMSEETRKERLQIPRGRLSLVIDTDAKNETDDQFAIAWALRSTDRFSVEAVYAAPFCYDCIKPGIPNWREHPTISSGGSPEDGMRKSYDEIQKIYDLLKLDGSGKIFHGATQYLTTLGKPVESDAVHDLIARARRSEGILYVAAIGAVTNLASALLLAPDIIEKIVIVWLGGELPEKGHGMEFNMMQDVKASQVLLESGVPLIWIPCRDVASVLTLTRRETKERLAGKNEICDYLTEIILDAIAVDEKWDSLPGDDDHNRIIWDIATIAALKNPEWVTSKLISAPILQDDLTLQETTDCHAIRMVTSCKRDKIFADMYRSITD